MGRHFWTKHIGDEHDHKQPGCISGLINVLDYHHWHSNTHHDKYAGQTGDWSPKVNLLPHDSREVESLLDEKQIPFLKTKRSRGNNKRSVKSRIKGLIAEEIYKERSDAQAKEGFLIKSRLQRTYSIHHLESLDDSISKICRDWKNPIIFLPGKLENTAPRSVDITQIKPADSNEASGGESDIFSAAKVESLEKTDFLDMVKIDKELFVRNLQIADQSVVRFSHVGLASNGLKFSKSRSFPGLNISQRLKFKPSKLADKQKETWYKRRSDEKDQDSLIKGPSDITKGLVDTSEETTMGRVGENTMRHYSDSRSSFLNESLDKYARLFDNSYRTDAKLNPSRSLRLANENSHTPMYSTRIRSRSMSNADYFYSNINLGVAGDDEFENDIFVIEKEDTFHQDVVEDDEKVVRLVASDSEKEPLDLIETVECKTEPMDMQRVDIDSGLNSNPIDESSETWEDFEEETQKQKSGDFFRVPESISCSDPCSILDSDTILQEKLSGSKQLEISEDKFVQGFEHVTDSGYVRLILDQSGIAKNASERAWHASDQLLSPQILRDVESCWPHEHDQLTCWQDFCSSCWQHQMLFDLVNETLLETYDISLPYYPKPLSSSCRVRPFPVGDRIVEEVCTSINKLLDLRTEERQSVDHVVVRDLKDDYRWMNLQFETECTGLELEDMILDDLVEELLCF